MRIRPAYIIIAIVLALGAFVIYAALSARDAVPPVAQPGRTPSGPGVLPPVDADQASVPMLEIETDELDMGTVTNREPTTTEIMVTNTGRRTLEIRQVTTTCAACTTSQMAQNQIRPGQSVPLEITVFPRGIPGFETQQRLTIMSNAANAPMQTVEVIVRVEPEFEVEPDGLDFGEIQKGERAQRTQVLRQVADEPIELVDVRFLDEAEKSASFAFEKRPESEWREPGKPEYTIAVTIEPWAPAGDYSRVYYLFSTCERVPRYRQRVEAVIESFYELSKDRLTFSMRPGVSRDEPVGTIVATAERPIEIVNAEITGDGFELKTLPGPEPNSATVEVYVAPDARVGRRNEELRFDVRAEDGTLLPNRLPVRGVVIDLQ